MSDGWLLFAGGLAVLMIRRLHTLRSASRSNDDARRALPELHETLALAVAAGLSPRDAVREAADLVPDTLHNVLSDIEAARQRGVRFTDALQVVRERLGVDAAGLVDVLVAADRDGLAVEPLLVQLAAEARAQRRRDAEADARRLPVRLAAPLVLCTLPGFVLIALVPLVAGALSSLSMP